MMFFRKSAKEVLDQYPEAEVKKILEEEMEKVGAFFNGKPLSQYQGLEEPVLENKKKRFGE